MPHIGISLFLFGFLIAGAATFRALEQQKDREYMDNKLERIRIVYEQIADEYKLCVKKTMKNDEEWRITLYRSLSQLSSRIENRPFELHPNREQQTTDEVSMD